MRRRELIGLVALVLAGGCTPEAGPGSTGSPDPSPVTSPRPTPPTVATGSTESLGWVSARAGYMVSCGLLTDGRALCWGGEDQEWARLAEPPVEHFTQVDFAGSGYGEGCGLRSDGEVRCWCARGDADAPVCREAPTSGEFVRVQHGTGWACAEDPEKYLTCWGSGTDGKADVPDEPLLDWAIETNGGCVVRKDGRVRCWGDVWFDLSPDAALAPPPELEYAAVAVGRDHACALDVDGEGHCWGSSWTRTPFLQPPPGPWDRIVSWNQVACVLRDSDGEAACWHDASFLPGYLYLPWVMPTERWRSIGLGEWSACGVTLDGRAVCFPEDYLQTGMGDVPALEDL